MSLFRAHGPTVATGGALLAVLAQPHWIMLGILAAPILCAWLIYSGWIIWTKPADRWTQLHKTIILVIAAVLVVGVQNHYVSASRKDADAVVNALWEYHDQHGDFPANLDSLGMNEKQLWSQWHLRYIRPAAEHSSPMRRYPVTYMFFDAFTYNFATQQWLYEADQALYNCVFHDFRLNPVVIN